MARSAGISFSRTAGARSANASAMGVPRAQASNAEHTETLSVTGMRLVDGAWYGQIVGATTNRENAYPEPGAAVYTVLSGRFDRIPSTPE